MRLDISMRPWELIRAYLFSDIYFSEKLFQSMKAGKQETIKQDVIFTKIQTIW